MSNLKLYLINNKGLLIKILVLITLNTKFISPGLASYNNILRLKAISGNYSDETIIRLHPQATYDFDSNWDAYKLSNGGNTPNFYSVLKSINYSINSIPDTLTNSIIPFKMVGAFSGNYSIVTTGIDSINFNPNFSVVLEDRLNNVFIDLWTASNYDFSTNAKDTSSRFYLHINSKTITSYQSSSSNYSSIPSSNNNSGLATAVNNQNNIGLINFYQQDHHIELTFNQNVGNTTFYCYNSNGEQIVKSSTINNCEGNIALEIPPFVKPGYYILEVLMEKDLYYKKFLIK